MTATRRLKLLRHDIEDGVRRIQQGLNAMVTQAANGTAAKDELTSVSAFVSSSLDGLLGLLVDPPPTRPPSYSAGLPRATGHRDGLSGTSGERVGVTLAGGPVGEDAAAAAELIELIRQAHPHLLSAKGTSALTSIGSIPCPAHNPAEPSSSPPLCQVPSQVICSAD